MYRDLFIDFDDTLYDTHGNAAIALRELAARVGLGRYFADLETFYDAYWKANIALWGQYARGEISRDFLTVERFRLPLSHGAGLEPSEAFCREVSALFLELCSVKGGLVDGARETMDYLRGKGYRMHLCSNGFSEVQYKKLRACGLEGYFETVILSEDAGCNKPARGYFEYALKRTGAERGLTLMIGDNLETDVLGAMGAGLKAVFFNRYPAYPATCRVDYEISSLRELRGIL